MTIPHLKEQEFIDFLKDNGCVIVSDANWEDYDRIILKKDDVTFPLQLQKIYYYFTVCKICEDLHIEPPEEHLKVLQQIRNRKKGKK